MSIAQDLFTKNARIGVIGLGYVGLPLALELSKHFAVVGFDTDSHRVSLMKQGVDPSGILDSSAFKDVEICFTTDLVDLQQVRFFIVAVPTPVDDFNIPDLNPLLEASATIGGQLKKGDVVVYESTVYPGCTEEKCLPVLEYHSGLKLGVDFKIGYSPERVNPGDKKNILSSIIKIVSGSDEEALECIDQVYKKIITAGTFKAKSIKIAEAAKIVENTQRDLNIALMNELSMIFDRLQLNTYDVLQAASTKWNFLPFTPGLVGGHCISVDPYYLTHKAEALGYEAKLISASRSINDHMAKHVARKVIMHLHQNAPDLNDLKVLVKGVTFKENVPDIRNSKIIDTVKEIMGYNIQVDIEDPYAIEGDVQKVYGLELIQEEKGDYDAVIIAISHDAYKLHSEAYFCSITKPWALIADLKGLYIGKITKRAYWSL